MHHEVRGTVKSSLIDRQIWEKIGGLALVSFRQRGLWDIPVGTSGRLLHVRSVA